MRHHQHHHQSVTCNCIKLHKLLLYDRDLDEKRIQRKREERKLKLVYLVDRLFRFRLPQFTGSIFTHLHCWLSDAVTCVFLFLKRTETNNAIQSKAHIIHVPKHVCIWNINNRTINYIYFAYVSFNFNLSIKCFFGFALNIALHLCKKKKTKKNYWPFCVCVNAEPCVDMDRNFDMNTHVPDMDRRVQRGQGFCRLSPS